MRQGTLITLYGEKPRSLKELINRCIEEVASVPGIQFKPYSIYQIHATIIGLERADIKGLCNRNIYNCQKRCAEMNIPGFLNYLKHSGLLPLYINIGGYKQSDNSFLSRGQIPYQRSFSIQGDKVVIMGWPFKELGNGDHSENKCEVLELIRKKAKKYNIQHLYHQTTEDYDNDLYIRIGTIDQNSISENDKNKVVDKVRAFLSEYQPIKLEIGMEDLCVASYTNESLPVDSTITSEIEKLISQPELTEVLYV